MRWYSVLVLFCMVRIAPSQFDSPWITEGPFNAASYTPAEWPGSGVAQGSVFIVKGFNLGPSRLVTASSFPLQDELGGTSLEVTVGETKVKPYLIYSSYGQVAALLPSGTPPGEGSLTLSYGGKTTSAVSIHVVRNSFGIFSVNQAGTGPGSIQNVNSETDRPVNALFRPARQNQAVIVWGTGLGPVTGDEQAGLLVGDLPYAVEVFVGGRPASILYKGRSGCCAGIDQIAVEVPQGVEGCYVPVAVKVGDSVSNFVTIAVAADGAECRDLPVLRAEDLARVKQGQSLNLARLELMRIELEVDTGSMSAEAVMEAGFGAFVRYRPYELMRGTDIQSYWRAGAPSPGYCAVVPATSNEDVPLPLYEDPYSNGPAALRAVRLDAGPQLYLSGRNGIKTFTRSNGAYFGFLGGLDPYEERLSPTYLDPGEYALDNREGGAEVGAFTTSLTVPERPVWLNRQDLREVDRSADLTISWRSPNPEKEQVTVFALSASGESLPTALLCTQDATAGQITVPAWMLSAMQVSETYEGLPLGVLGVMSSTAGPGSFFTAPGIDAGVVQVAQGRARYLAFR
ncbi:MAG: hypothetical protein IT158_17320 [Bryobacterales bacterium]|nr:hypothetical protein [Bryobacterales bacterium]